MNTAIQLRGSDDLFFTSTLVFELCVDLLSEVTKMRIKVAMIFMLWLFSAILGPNVKESDGISAKLR